MIAAGGAGAGARSASPASSTTSQSSASSALRAEMAQMSVGGRPRRNMLFLLPKFPMLNSPHSACYARIMPNYARFCRLISERRVGKPAYSAWPWSAATTSPQTSATATATATAPATATAAPTRRRRRGSGGRSRWTRWILCTPPPPPPRNRRRHRSLTQRNPHTRPTCRSRRRQGLTSSTFQLNLSLF